MHWKDFLLYPTLGFILKGVFWGISWTRLPKLHGKILLSGLKSPVEILRDNWGIPHINADNAQDLVFAQGFSHAQERLWQMDFTRRVVSGRLSEVLGCDALPYDREMRILGLYRTAQKEAAAFGGMLGALLQAYRDGVNAWIEMAIKNRKLPIEFLLLDYQPDYWQISDSFAVGKMMSWVLAGNWQTELYRFLLSQQVGAEKLADFEEKINHASSIIPDLGSAQKGKKKSNSIPQGLISGLGKGLGSNNWVIHGQKTNTGKPLLANDMHLELSVPAIWYENHLSGGEFDVTGISIPGVPLIISGHNQGVAWGFTNSCADVQDLYEEQLRHTREGGWAYKYKGVWLPAVMRNEEIRIKGAESVIEVVVSTQHGPLINPLFEDIFPDLPPLALRWTAFDGDTNFRALYYMNTARDSEEFHQALRDFCNPSENTVYADVHGEIGYALNGHIPIRKNSDGSFPVPGWTGDHEWLGTIPFDALPHLVNPACGYAATANNQIQGLGKPYLIGKDSLVEDRFERICELIDSKEKIDLDFIKGMQYDQVSISARKMAKVLGSLQLDEPVLKAIVGQMRNWEGNLDKDSAMASIFGVLVRIALNTMVNYHFDVVGQRAAGKGPYAGKWPFHLWVWFFNLLEQPASSWFNMGNGETRDDVLCTNLRETVEYLRAKFGPDISRWQWGHLHQLTFTHCLGGRKPLDRVFNIGQFPIGGDGNTIWASHASLDVSDLTAKYGPPFRFIADLADLDHCWGQLVPGQSGNLASRHYRDGVEDWFKGKYHPMLFNRDDVEKHLEEKLFLTPSF